MTTPSAALRALALAGLLSAAPAFADSWMPPNTEVTPSADGRTRVTVTPRPLGGALPYFEDKVKGVEPAGQRRGETQRSPVARVERLGADGTWSLVWQMPLVNDVGPTNVLLANDAAFLVTFDNWHSAGWGDDVVVIYDSRGDKVRQLSLEEILPPEYVHFLPTTVSSRWWGSGHVLVEGETMVELQVVSPEVLRDELAEEYEEAEQAEQNEVAEDAEDAEEAEPVPVPVRIRLADGAVVPPAGERWEQAMAAAKALEAWRLAGWNRLRELRASPLPAPASDDTAEWRDYMFELRDRIAADDEMIGGMVLAAPGADPGWHSAKAIAGAIKFFDAEDELSRGLIVASPASDRLATVVVDALRAHAADALKGAHLVFVGTREEGERVAAAASHTGAKITLVDRSVPFPAGEPLPPSPPERWLPDML